MTESKYFPLIVFVTVIAAVLITTALIADGYKNAGTQSLEEPEYVDRIFDEDSVTEINIDIDQQDWDWLIENAGKEEYRACDVTINGITLKNVGIRPKGNSSLRTVIQDDTTDRFSFKLEFDTYVEGQDCFGLSKLVLNNMLSDNTFMKEFIAYDMFHTMGVVTPEYAYANITINGEPWGLYLAVESMEEEFVERNYGSTTGNLYRPEGTGADLVWRGNSASYYSGIKNGAAYNVTNNDFEKVITMIENLNAGTDLEKYLDVDAVLRYFAVNSFLVNFDNYTGQMQHNYYLYEEDGVCTILPWDLNLAFAGFGIRDAEEAINYPIDTPVTGALSERPLIGKLLEVPEYKELYHKYLGEFVKTYIESGLYQDTIKKTDALIAAYVKNDATAFCTYEEYRESLPVLLKFGQLRARSITNQLAGTQGSVAQEASNASGGVTTDTQKVSGEGVDLRALGSMGGGGGAGFGQKQPKPGEDNANAPDIAKSQANEDDQNDQAVAGGTKQGGNIPGGGAPPEGMERPDNGGGPPGRGNMPEPETMTKIREIVDSVEGNELSEQQIAELKELGLNDEMIERIKSMPAGGMRPLGEGNPIDQGGGPGDMFAPGNGEGRRMTPQQLVYTGVSAILLLVGLIVVQKTRKRKFSS